MLVGPLHAQTERPARASAMRTAMMAITTSSSTKVKPRNLRLMFNALEKMIKKNKSPNDAGGLPKRRRIKSLEVPDLTLPTKVPSDSLGRIGSLKKTSDKSLFPMALGSCGHRITHQLRPINMNGRSILAVTSDLRASKSGTLQSRRKTSSDHLERQDRITKKREVKRHHPGGFSRSDCG